jgi:DNA-binding Lrp family transcriptional regulator
LQDVSATVIGIAGFSFLTNHGLALLCIAADPNSRMRDIASSVNITERAAQRIVADLVDAGYIERTKVGRRNEYAVRLDLAVDLPNARDVDLNTLLGVLLPADASAARREQISA